MPGGRFVDWVGRGRGWVVFGVEAEVEALGPALGEDAAVSADADVALVSGFADSVAVAVAVAVTVAVAGAVSCGVSVAWPVLAAFEPRPPNFMTANAPPPSTTTAASKIQGSGLDLLLAAAASCTGVVVPNAAEVCVPSGSGATPGVGGAAASCGCEVDIA